MSDKEIIEEELLGPEMSPEWWNPEYTAMVKATGARSKDEKDQLILQLRHQLALLRQELEAIWAAAEKGYQLLLKED